MSLRAEDKIEVHELLKTSKTMRPLYKIQEVTKSSRPLDVDHENEEEEAWDDIDGKFLNPAKVKIARNKEIGYVREKGVYVRMKRTEANKRGIRVVGTRWIDHNKGDEDNEDIRSRLVAKDFNQSKMEGLFAATPPLEGLKLLLSEAATMEDWQEIEGEKQVIVMINDVARAFFEADMINDLCVEIPEEDRTQEDEDGDNVGYLVKSLYGTRDAAANFQREVRKSMEQS